MQCELLQWLLLIISTSIHSSCTAAASLGPCHKLIPFEIQYTPCFHKVIALPTRLNLKILKWNVKTIFIKKKKTVCYRYCHISLTTSTFRNLPKNKILWYFPWQLCQEAVKFSLLCLLIYSASLQHICISAARKHLPIFTILIFIRQPGSSIPVTATRGDLNFYETRGINSAFRTSFSCIKSLPTPTNLKHTTVKKLDWSYITTHFKE